MKKLPKLKYLHCCIIGSTKLDLKKITNPHYSSLKVHKLFELFKVDAQANYYGRANLLAAKVAGIAFRTLAYCNSENFFRKKFAVIEDYKNLNAQNILP